MIADRWALTVATLLGDPLPPLPDLPGRVHQCTDRPLTDAELEAIDDPRELSLVLGVSKKYALQMLQQRQEAST